MATYLEIDLKAFSNNLNQVNTIVGERTTVMPVLKADAYGHGAALLAKTVQANGISCIAVGSPDEAVCLRDSGITTTLLALDGIIDGHEKTIIKQQISSVVSCKAQLDTLDKTAKKLNIPAKIHLKLDTGMGRLGAKPDQFLSLCETAYKKKNILIEGAMTHFATAFKKDDLYTIDQINLFRTMIEKIKKAGYPLPVCHAANSGGILNYTNSFFDAVRPGIVLYGSLPDPDKNQSFQFDPVMCCKSKIVHISSLTKGESVSYDRKFVAEKDMKIAAIPVGYSSGYTRILSNRTSVLVGGKRVPQLGIICMDLTVIDITNIPDVMPGDEVVLVGKQGNEQITIEELAKKADSISYEMMCMLGNSLPKRYINNENYSITTN